MPETRSAMIADLRETLRAKAVAVAAAAPPLTPQQREQLRPILAGQLARRREAALRLPPLTDGRHDPVLERRPA